jgi:hypothetical protein
MTASSTKAARGALISMQAGSLQRSATKDIARAGACTNLDARARSRTRCARHVTSMRSPEFGRSEPVFHAWAAPKRESFGRWERSKRSRSISPLPRKRIRPIFSTAGQLKVGAAGLVGAIAGAVGGAAWVASRRFQSSMEAGVTRIAADRAQAETPKAANVKSAEKKED